MFKKILFAAILITVVGLLIFGAVNRTLALNNDTGTSLAGSRHNDEAGQTLSESRYDGTNGQGNGGQSQHGGKNGNNPTGSESNAPALEASGDLDANETAALLTMREEEKLAHDVYMTLSNQWDLPIFQNISQSEQTHMDAIKALIDRYNLTDPASDTIGVYTKPDLQALHDSLVNQGSQSLSEALRVGAAIEEIDILDLDIYLSQTDNIDIRQVFTNLKLGSHNHLNAFTSTLYRLMGEVYLPYYLSVDAYQAIISSETGGRSSAGSSGGYHGGRP